MLQTDMWGELAEMQSLSILNISAIHYFVNFVKISPPNMIFYSLKRQVHLSNGPGFLFRSVIY